MGRVLMNDPPECPEPCGWCVICLMRAKQQQWELSQDQIQPALAASGEKLTVIPWLDGLTRELRPGRWRAVAGDAPQLGLVQGLCWDCVAGMQPVQAPQLIRGQGVPDGLLRGRG